jgi:hypothetical protein
MKEMILEGRTNISGESIITNLISNLESQLEIHEILLEALHCEGRLPASCTLTELHEVQSIRDFAVRRIRELESGRLRLIERYKQANEISRKLSLKEIIEQSTPQQQQTLLNLRHALLQVISNIKPAGRRNAEIAVSRISCFNEIQGALDKSFKRLSTYSGNGIITRAKGESRLNKSI